MGDVFIRYQKGLPEPSIFGILKLQLDDSLIDYFNIPVPDAAALEAFTAATTFASPGFTYTRYNGVDDTIGTPVVVPAHERSIGTRGKGTIKNVVRVPLVTLKTSRGKYRTTSFKFPSFFTVYMIDQAVGSMIKRNQPPSYVLRNLTRPFNANASTAPLGSLSSGAWVVTSFTDSVSQ